MQKKQECEVLSCYSGICSQVQMTVYKILGLVKIAGAWMALLGTQ